MGVSLARRHREVLAKLDPVAVARYQITEKDIRTIERYLRIIQARLEVEGVSLCEIEYLVWSIRMTNA